MVQSRTIEPGAVVATGKTLLTVIDPRAVYVRAYVPEGDLSKIYVGQSARVLLDTDSKQAIKGKIGSIDPKASFTNDGKGFPEDEVLAFEIENNRSILTLNLSVDRVCLIILDLCWHRLAPPSV